MNFICARKGIECKSQNKEQKCSELFCYLPKDCIDVERGTRMVEYIKAFNTNAEEVHEIYASSMENEYRKLESELELEMELAISEFENELQKESLSQI